MSLEGDDMKYRRICNPNKLSFNPVQHMISTLASSLDLTGKYEITISSQGIVLFIVETPIQFERKITSEFYQRTNLDLDQSLSIMRQESLQIKLVSKDYGRTQEITCHNILLGSKDFDYPRDGGGDFHVKAISDETLLNELDIEDVALPLLYIFEKDTLFGPSSSFFNVYDLGVYERNGVAFPLVSTLPITKSKPTADLQGKAPLFYFTDENGYIERVMIREAPENLRISSLTYVAALSLCSFLSELVSSPPDEALFNGRLKILRKHPTIVELFEMFDGWRKSDGIYYIPVSNATDATYHCYPLEVLYFKIRRDFQLIRILGPSACFFSYELSAYISTPSVDPDVRQGMLFYRSDFKSEDRNGAATLAYAIACVLNGTDIPPLHVQISALVHVAYNPRLSSYINERISVTSSGNTNKEFVDVLDLPQNLLKKYPRPTYFTKIGCGFYDKTVFNASKFMHRKEADHYVVGDFVLLSYNGTYACGKIVQESTFVGLLFLTSLEGVPPGTIVDVSTPHENGVKIFPISVMKGVVTNGTLTTEDSGIVGTFLKDQYHIIPLEVENEG